MFCLQDDLDLPVKVLRGHLGKKLIFKINTEIFVIHWYFDLSLNGLF